jgi:hypothetical protein
MPSLKLRIILSAVLVVAISAGAVYAFSPDRNPVNFFSGHTHSSIGTDIEDDITTGAPQHGGGLDRYGCHNRSVPYHCHR